MPHPIFDQEHPDYIRPSLNDFGEETQESQMHRNYMMIEYDNGNIPRSPHIIDSSMAEIARSRDLTNYADEPITCNECGMRCTRPTAKTIRTKTCKLCRKKIRNREIMQTSPNEKGNEPMDDKKETIVVNQSQPKKGILQKMRIQRTAEGIQLIYESPIMQSFFKTWFYEENYPEKDSSSGNWRSNIFPERHESRTYFSLRDIQAQYKKLLYFAWNDTRLVDGGKPNFGFLQAVNDFPVKENGDPLGKLESSSAFKADKTMRYMNPNKPIVITLRGLFPNKVLDDFMMRTKEVMYQIYSDNLMPFDKSVIISMESKDETPQT